MMVMVCVRMCVRVRECASTYSPPSSYQAPLHIPFSPKKSKHIIVSHHMKMPIDKILSEKGICRGADKKMVFAVNVLCVCVCDKILSENAH